MAINQLKALPLGSDFIALRIADEIYVDKTEMVFSLVVKRGKYFLARPRRFGKSLLISTFESLFKFGLRDFKGLAIENLWKEDAVYNVVRLDFSEIKDFADAESFSERLISLLSKICALWFLLRTSPLPNSFGSAIRLVDCSGKEFFGSPNR